MQLHSFTLCSSPCCAYCRHSIGKHYTFGEFFCEKAHWIDQAIFNVMEHWMFVPWKILNLATSNSGCCKSCSFSSYVLFLIKPSWFEMCPRKLVPCNMKMHCWNKFFHFGGNGTSSEMQWEDREKTFLVYVSEEDTRLLLYDGRNMRECPVCTSKKRKYLMSC